MKQRIAIRLLILHCLLLVSCGSKGKRPLKSDVSNAAPATAEFACSGELKAELKPLTYGPYSLSQPVTWELTIIDPCGAGSFIIETSENPPIATGRSFYTFVKSYNVSGKIKETAKVTSVINVDLRKKTEAQFEIEIQPASAGNPTIGTLTATATSTTAIRLDWEDTSQTEGGFRVQRFNTTEQKFETIANVDPNVANEDPNLTSYTNSGLMSGTTYLYQIEVFNGVGEVFSNIAGTKTASETTPEKPTAPLDFMGAAISVSQINLSWVDFSDNEESFIIDRRLCGQGSYTTVANLSPDVECFTNYGLAKKTCYDYRIRAHNIAGDSEPLKISVTTLDSIPSAPVQKLPTQLTAYSVKLHWESTSNNHTSFRVERSLPEDGAFSTVGNVGAGQTTFTDNSLSPSTTYEYRIIALNSIGESIASNIQKVLTKDVTVGVVVSLGVLSQANVTITPTEVILNVIDDYFAYDLEIFSVHSDGSKTLVLYKPGNFVLNGQYVFPQGLYSFYGDFSKILIGNSQGTGNNRPKGYTVRTTKFAERPNNRDADGIVIASGSNRNNLYGIEAILGSFLSFEALDFDWGSGYYQIAVCAKGWNCYPMTF